MQNKPDNRKDNVERIQEHIDETIRNMEAADEMIAKASNPQTKRELREKNERRDQALDGMRHEIRDEAKHRETEKT